MGRSVTPLAGVSRCSSSLKMPVAGWARIPPDTGPPRLRLDDLPAPATRLTRPPSGKGDMAQGVRPVIADAPVGRGLTGRSPRRVPDEVAPDILGVVPGCDRPDETAEPRGPMPDKDDT